MKRSGLPILILTLALAACSAHTSDGGPHVVTKMYFFPASPTRDVDMLFVVDNSLGMKVHQTKLVRDFPALTSTLANLPGGMPNLHLAVVSSDLGAGPYSEKDIPNCRTGGDQGVFQSEQRLAQFCENGNLMPDQTFIVAGSDPGANNFTGTLEGTFGCIAGLGSAGCGYEHQLASALRALGADGSPFPLPPTNAGFLRPNAYLFVVLVTDEDDCSAPPASQLFNPESMYLSDPLGPLASYRCNEFGHVCGGNRPPRTPPPGGADLTGTCHSAEDGTLLKVSDVATRLKGLKPGPLVYVAALAGPPDPYVVETGPATLGDDPNQQWPHVSPSCTTPSGSFADPGVRINDLVRDFGSNGLFQTICNDSFAPALTGVGNLVGRAVAAVPCLDAGTVPSQCAFVDVTPAEQGRPVETPLPSCLTNGNEAPCWSATSSDAACGGGPRVQIVRPPGGPVADLTTIATCPVP